MVHIGIAAKDEEQVHEIMVQLYNHLNIRPARGMRGYAVWFLPLMQLEVFIGNEQARGRRFDLLYCEETIEDEYVNNILYPSVMTRAKLMPLSRFMEGLEHDSL